MSLRKMTLRGKSRDDASTPAPDDDNESINDELTPASDDEAASEDSIILDSVEDLDQPSHRREAVIALITSYNISMGDSEDFLSILDQYPATFHHDTTYQACIPWRLSLARSPNQDLYAWMRPTASGFCHIRFDAHSDTESLLIDSKDLLRVVPKHDFFKPPFRQLLAAMRAVRHLNDANVARIKCLVTYLFFRGGYISEVGCGEHTCFYQGLFTGVAMLNGKRGMIGKAEAKAKKGDKGEVRVCGCVAGPQGKEEEDDLICENDRMGSDGDVEMQNVDHCD